MPDEETTFSGTMRPLFFLRPGLLACPPCVIECGRQGLFNTERDYTLGMHPACTVYRVAEKTRLEGALFYVYVIKIPNKKFTMTRKRILIQTFLQVRPLWSSAVKCSNHPGDR